MARGKGLQLPARPPQTPGLPENFQLLTIQEFQGLNTKAARAGIGDQQMSWCENWMPLGPANLRAMPDAGAPIFTVASGQALEYFAFANVSSTPIAVVFPSDGSIIQVTTNGSNAPTTMAGASTINSPALRPAVAQWGSQFVVIAAQQSNGYMLWDGTAFYQAGTISPSVDLTTGGAAYTSPPTVTPVGGSGSGTNFKVTVENGAVTLVTVLSAGTGYVAGDVVYLAFSGGGGPRSARATATISGGGVTAISIQDSGTGYVNGSAQVAFLGGGAGFGAAGTVTVNSSGLVTVVTLASSGFGYTTAPTVVFTDTNNTVAQATVQTMPWGVTGNSAEVYTSRVWIGGGTPNGSSVEYTAPGSPTDVSSANGGGSFTSHDSFLRVGFTELRQTNGFLYLFADSSINYISGVNTAGTPPTTTFNNQNIDPQTGTSWPDTIAALGRSLPFANAFGVFVLNGGSVQKVSEALDGIYTSVPTSAFSITPSAGVFTLYGTTCYALLLPIVNPVTETLTNTLLCWDRQRWWSATQSPELKAVKGQEFNSQLSLWGHDGKSLFPLFQTPSSGLTKTIQTKLWDTPSYIVEKHVERVWGLAQTQSGFPINMTVYIDTEQRNQAATVPVTNTNAVTWRTTDGTVAVWTTASGAVATWLASGTALIREGTDTAGYLVGMTIETNTQDMTLISMAMSAEQYTIKI